MVLRDGWTVIPPRGDSTGSWLEQASIALTRARSSVSDPEARLIGLQVEASAMMLLGESAKIFDLVTEHAHALVGVLRDTADLARRSDHFDADYDIMIPLRFGVRSAIARADQLLSRALFELWLAPRCPVFDESMVTLES